MTYASPGDLLIRSVNGSMGMIEHFGVMVAENLIYHNTRVAGEHLSDRASFAQGAPVRICRFNARARRDTLRRAHLELQRRRPYNLLVNNCEHTASRVVRGQPCSHQLRRAALIVAAIGLLAWLTSDEAD
jgi:beta-xylosidase